VGTKNNLVRSGPEVSKFWSKRGLIDKSSGGITDKE